MGYNVVRVDVEEWKVFARAGFTRTRNGWTRAIEIQFLIHASVAPFRGAKGRSG